MYTFLIASIPLLLLILVTNNNSFSWKSFIPPIAFGLTIGMIYALVKKFFIYSSFILTEDTNASFIHLLLTQTILPIVICLAAFLIFSRDSAVYKAESLGPMLAAFYAVVVPFSVISGPDKTTTFMLFGKPLLYSGMFILLSLFAALGTAKMAQKKIVIAIPFYLIALVQIPIPAFIENRWYYTMDSMSLTVSIAYAAIALFFYLFVNVINMVVKPSKA
ncbi:MAG: hypothetical protein J6Y69_08470 [Treponema sp.]|nr:hypothetical protein [Treponema sp.]